MSVHPPNISDIAQLRHETLTALQVFYSIENTSLPERLLFMTGEELTLQFEWALDELDTHLMLGILAALEAHFRKDFNYRRQNRLKDNLSRSFRKIRKKHVRLDDDILDTWKKHHPSKSKQVSEIKSVLHLRHWLAHGRYWVPKLGRNYDFFYVEELAVNTVAAFDFK